MDYGYLKTNPCNVKKKFGDLSDKKHSVTNLAFSIFCYLSLLAHEWELGGLNCEP